MLLLKKIFDFYLNASIHVAVATSALVQMTFYFCRLPFDVTVTAFVFFGTVFSYNFIKYASFAAKQKTIGFSLKGIIALSVLSLIITVYCFFCLQLKTQLVSILFGVLCI